MSRFSPEERPDVLRTGRQRRRAIKTMLLASLITISTLVAVLGFVNYVAIPYFSGTSHAPSCTLYVVCGSHAELTQFQRVSNTSFTYTVASTGKYGVYVFSYTLCLSRGSLQYGQNLGCHWDLAEKWYQDFCYSHVAGCYIAGGNSQVFLESLSSGTAPSTVTTIQPGEIFTLTVNYYLATPNGYPYADGGISMNATMTGIIE